MTTGLERKAHRLVELGRAGDDPSATQLLSLHGAVTARIASEGASALASAAATPKAIGAGALVKGLLVAGALATAAAAFFVLRGEEPPSSPPVPATVAPPQTQPDPALPPAEPPPAPASVALPTPSRPSRPPPTGLRLQDEAALLAEVQGALRSDKPKLALSKLGVYERRFPNGVLRAEADAARVFALCSLGQSAKARAEAARFLRAWPRSPLATRVSSSCGAPLKASP